MTLGHVTLDGREYMVEPREYVREQVNQMAAKVGQGESEYKDLTSYSAWIMENWQRGVGQKDPRAGGFLYAEADTRFPEQFILPAWMRLTHHTDQEELSGLTRGADITVDGTTIVKVACQSNATNGGNVEACWTYIEGSAGTVITAEIYDVSGGDPNTLQGTTTATLGSRPGGHWVRFVFSPAVATASAFFFVLSGNASFSVPTIQGTVSLKYWDGDSWEAQGSASTALAGFSLEHSSLPAALDSIASKRSGDRWVAVGGGDIYLSTNDGQTWSDRGNVTGSHPSIATDRAGVWIAARAGATTVQRSTDDGSSWGTVIVGAQGGLSRCLATDRSGVWCLGGVQNGGANAAYISRSTDNGATWTNLYDPGTDGLIRQIATDIANNWIAISADVVFTSSDNGANWTRQGSKFSGASVYDDGLRTDEAGNWVSATTSGIWRSTDNGANWTQVYSTGGVKKVAWEAGATWTAVTATGEFLKSTDNGASWSPITGSMTGPGTFAVLDSDGAGLWLASYYNANLYKGYTGTNVDQTLRIYDQDGISSGSSTTNKILSFNGEVYLFNHGSVYKWVEANNAWGSAISIGANSVKDCLAWGGVLWIGLGSTNARTMATNETFTEKSGINANLFLSWNGYLWRAYENDIYYTADGSTWTGPFAVGPDDYEIRGMAGLEEDVIIATDEGLYRLGLGDIVWGITPFGTIDSSNGVGTKHYQGAVYVPVGQDLLQYSPEGTIQNVGLNRYEGLPADRQGRVKVMAGLNNWLLAAVNPTQAAGIPTLWAYSGQGWHHIMSLPPDLDISDLLFERDALYLWVACTDASHSIAARIVLPNDLTNPYKDNRSDILFAPYGWLETDWFYGNVREAEKDCESVYIAGENISATRWVKVYWQDDDSSGWELLGVVTSNGQELRWASDRPATKRIKLGILLRSDDMNETPVVNAVRLKYDTMVRDWHRWHLSVLVSGTSETPQQLLDGASNSYTRDQQLAHLTTLATQTAPFIFKSMENEQYQVKVTNSALNITRIENRGGARDWEGKFRMTVEQITPGTYSP